MPTSFHSSETCCLTPGDRDESVELHEYDAVLL